MHSFEENDTLYTDIVMQLFSSFITTDAEDRGEYVQTILHSAITDPDVEGPGLLAGLLYASIIHMSLLLGTLSKITNKSREEILKDYALNYSKYRVELSNLPQLRPEFVNYLMFKFLNEENN